MIEPISPLFKPFAERTITRTVRRRCLLTIMAAVMSVSMVGTASAQQVRIPSSGAYLGLLTSIPGLSKTESMAKRESQFSRTFDIDSYYYGWTERFPGSAVDGDIAHGRIPMITWWGTKYAAINNGSQDRLIRAAAHRIKAFGHPLFIRWAAEMNGDWFDWSGPRNNNNPAGFVSAWRRVHRIFAAEGVRNVSWVWCPNSPSAPGGWDTSSWNNWRNYYPGDAYVDWVGIVGYNWGSLPGGDGWLSFGRIMRPIYHDYASRKPIMIGETGSTESGGDKAQWIRGLRTWIKGHQAVKAVVWFDRSYISTGHDWGIDTSLASMTAFGELAKDPYFNVRAPPAAGEGVGAKVSASKTQRQRRWVRVKIKLAAWEQVTARATGNVKFDHGKLRLRPRSQWIGAGRRATVTLKLKKRRADRKVMRALKHRKKVHAAVRVRFTDESDNRAHRRVVVRLK